MNELARRALLYGSAAAAIWCGAGALDAVRARAERQPPPAAPLSRQFPLGQRTLDQALRAAGCSARQAASLSAAAGERMDLRRLDPRVSVALTWGEDGEPLHLTLLDGAARVVVTRGPEGLRAARREDQVSVRERLATGEVRGSLWAAMRAAGVPADVVLGFAEAFQWTVDFLTETRNGDHFAVAWTERAAGARVLERRVEAAAYDGRAAGSRTAVYFDGEYFDAAGESLRRRFLRAPLRFSRVSSRFDPRRRHPILRVNRPHHGTDYAAPRGTPVSAVADGVILAARAERGFGNVVKIRHDPTYTTLYAHLSRFAPGLRPGARVAQGKVIGYVGSTGLATGPHLHFQIEKDGRWADFLTLDLPFARSVPRSRRAAFEEARDRHQPELVLSPAAAEGRSAPSAGG
jgi:murein DD-endopeptidase MepM/ murein hydrolase activator NlpD